MDLRNVRDCLHLSYSFCACSLCALLLMGNGCQFCTETVCWQLFWQLQRSWKEKKNTSALHLTWQSIFSNIILPCYQILLGYAPPDGLFKGGQEIFHEKKIGCSWQWHQLCGIIFWLSCAPSLPILKRLLKILLFQEAFECSLLWILGTLALLPYL